MSRLSSSNRRRISFSSSCKVMGSCRPGDGPRNVRRCGGHSNHADVRRPGPFVTFACCAGQPAMSVMQGFKPTRAGRRIASRRYRPAEWALSGCGRQPERVVASGFRSSCIAWPACQKLPLRHGRRAHAALGARTGGSGQHATASARRTRTRVVAADAHALQRERPGINGAPQRHLSRPPPRTTPTDAPPAPDRSHAAARPTPRFPP